LFYYLWLLILFFHKNPSLFHSVLNFSLAFSFQSMTLTCVYPSFSTVSCSLSPSPLQVWFCRLTLCCGRILQHRAV
jgi:hypothetical protein